jgi:sugar lactone lactonase YvrE
MALVKLAPQDNRSFMLDFTIISQTPNRLGEVPVWSVQDACLWWVDVLGAVLHRYEPATGRQASYPVPVRRLGCVALRARGGLVLGTDQGVLGFDPETGETTLLVQPEPGKPTHRLNDGRCDRAGRLWIGSMNEQAFVPEGTFFRIDPDLTVTRTIEGFIVPNSVAFSPDDRTFYFADTRAYTIWAFDLDLAEGRISNRRVFATANAPPGRPDGSCVDQSGFLWNAEFAGGRLVRYAPDGRIDRIVALPVTHPTCCSFGGPDLGTLFVTSAADPQMTGEPAGRYSGKLLALDVGVRGLPEPAFAG